MCYSNCNREANNFGNHNIYVIELGLKIVKYIHFKNTRPGNINCK
uniref:Uncharacterized protein n=1 Tax=Anguilla anguilla TaxID=7936 RepID=A0A0E9SNE4_ANGAN